MVFLVHAILHTILAGNLCFPLLVTRTTIQWNDERLMLMGEAVSCRIFLHKSASREWVNSGKKLPQILKFIKIFQLYFMLFEINS